MSANATYEKLKSFLESKPASLRAVQHLKRGIEIGIVIGNQIHCAYFNNGGNPTLQLRPANGPDVVFFIKPESVDILTSENGEDVGELGIAVLKEYLSGGIRIRAPGSLLALSMNGYLGVIKEGGITFAKFLAQHGISNFSKIMSVIRDLKYSKNDGQKH